MKWYIVKLVFNISHVVNIPSIEFDEQFRMIQARTEEEAFLKARLIGVKNENSFENADGELVNWNFVDVAYVKELDPFADGMELFSNSLETENPVTHIRFVQHQAETIYNKLTPHPHAVTAD